ncbi:hypothetical protein F441_13304 [Phytophthora nicotianae CJ01A1]|uniref:BZIP domain-containing protein n=2 Tax=Phytophthora nicotianae TaxID=4792 RepID=W2WKY8_PHYNI|nr:hypothetical protein L915_13052 [Phytophthora nicotianae]ETP11161.1 hypothetical protein F441_13304 [Phytophthora nicotianae CJ01A1]
MTSEPELDTAFLEDVALFDCNVSTLKTSQKETKASRSSKSSSATTRLVELDNEIRRSRETGRLRLYRRRVRNERDSLQRQEKVLTEKLLQLQQTRSDQRSFSPTDIGISSSLWRAIAAQQLQERLEAEAEQKLLKASIKAQDACIEVFQEMLRSKQENRNEKDKLESLN